jgi:hypothetical protein
MAMHRLLYSMPITGMGATRDREAIVSSVTAIAKKHTTLTISSRTMRKVGPNTGLQEVFGCNGTPRGHSRAHGHGDG